MSRDKESVLDIIEAVKKILAYTAGVTLAEFWRMMRSKMLY
jgi:uncharacterized protein with HEPN domain